MKRKLTAGITSVMLPIKVRDTSSTTGAGLTGLVFNTAGLTAEYRRQGQSSWTAISLVTATLGTFTSGGFIADGSRGAYELGVPNAALASGARWVAIRLYGATNMLDVDIEIELDAVDYQDSVRAGLTALPNAAAEAAGGLFTRGTGAGQINQPGNGLIDVSLKAILGTLLTETSGQIAAAFKKFFDKASPTGTINSIPDAVAGASGGLALVGSNVGAATSVTGAVGSVTGNVGGDVVGNVQGSVASVTDRTGFSLSAAGVKAIWDQLLSATFTSGSLGEKIKAFFAALGSDERPKISADAHTAGAAVASVTGAVGSVTGNVGGNLSGSVGSVAGAVGSVSGDVSGKVLGGGSGTITGAGVRATAVDGAVGSVSGAVGSVAGNVGGDVAGKVLGGGASSLTGDGVRAASVTGAVGSVIGNVGGNVVGSVGSVATDGISADSVSAAAVTKIQSGLATAAALTTLAAKFTGITLLANWLRAIARKSNNDATAVSEINANNGTGTGTFDPTTDSPEAIRDRGDSAWGSAGGGASAADVWAYASRTLTQTAAQIAAAVAGSTITIQRGDTLSAALTDVGSLTGRTKLWFTVKRRGSDADSAALIQIEETAGLITLNGGTPGSGQTGSITVNDVPTGDVTIALSATAAAALPLAQELVYDIQILTASGVVTRAAGIAHIAADVTRAVS